MPIRTRAANALRGAVARLDPKPGPARPADPQVPTSTSKPGSRVASMFFDQYPRFYETSQTTPGRCRLNLRYEAIFAENREIFAGARVLDIASHDGRWSLAALACGAESVIGIEARPHLVEHATENLTGYGWGKDRFSFLTEDVYDAFDKHEFDVDVVLCLGFLYHTMRYNELLQGIRAANPRHIIIDTISPLMMAKMATVFVKQDPAMRESAAVSDKYSPGDKVLVGQPNLRAIQTMVRTYGFEVERLSDWDGLLRDNTDLEGVDDYARHLRQTIRCVDRRRLTD